jgi:hypothetical protein
MNQKTPPDRMYSGMWRRLKANLTLQVMVTTSNSPEVRTKLIRTLRKALQKEKYRDLNFRAEYPNAVLETKVLPDGAILDIRLITGMSTRLTHSVVTIFGGTDE